MRYGFVLLVLVLGVFSLVNAKEMPIPHFNESDCACPELGWKIVGNASAYGLGLDCIYSIGEKRDYFNEFYLHITSWYDPADTQRAYEIARDYDLKREKEYCTKDCTVVEDSVGSDRLSHIHRGTKTPSQYSVFRRLVYGRTPLIAISGKYTVKKDQPFIDDQVIGWADALEACGKRLIDAQDLSGNSVKGRISVLGFPMKYATIYPEEDPEAKTATDAAGSFSVTVPNQEHYNLIMELQYEKGSHIYYRVTGNKREEPLRLIFDVENNIVTSIQVDAGENSYNIDVEHDLKNELKLEKYLTEENGLLIAPVHYLHMQEALEYYIDVAKVDLSKSTIDLLTYTGEKTSYEHENGKQWILLDTKKSRYENEYRPFSHYHEFSHYAQNMIEGTVFDSYLDAQNINHGGFANQKTSDSFSEGFAAYMATVIANHYKRHWASEADDKPSFYPFYGSLETDYRAWDYKGKVEEYAVAGILWDLIDGKEEAQKDSAADLALKRKLLQDVITEHDFDNDNALSHAEFFHLVINQAEFNSDMDDYFDRDELEAIAADLAMPNGVQALIEKMESYGKEEEGKLNQTEMYLFIKANTRLFEDSLKEKSGAESLAQRITADAILDDVQQHPDDDNMDLKTEELWQILKKPHADFTSVYNELISRFPKDKQKIDSIFIKHGFFADNDEGNHQYDEGEPYLDLNMNNRRNDNEPVIDLGNMQFQEGERIGSASNYERSSRKSTEPLAGQYIKVNPEVPYYDTQYVNYDADYFGLKVPGTIYTLRASSDNGLIYAPVPPMADIIVKPEGVQTSEELRVSSDAFLSQAEQKDYYGEKTFAYTGTPPVYKSPFGTTSGGTWFLAIGVVATAGILLVGYLVFRRKRHKHKP